MFAAILLAVLPSAPLFGAPCVCFEIKHAGTRPVPDEPFAKTKWNAQQLMEECMKAVVGTDDVFVRAEALRTTLRAMDQQAEKDPKGVEGARLAVFDRLSSDLKSAKLLSPLSSTTIEVERDLEETQKRLAALPGVVRVDRAPSKSGLRAWFDARTVSAQQLQETAAVGALPVIEPPTNRPRAIAAITLAFAGQSASQLGSRVDFDPRALARQAAELAPKDARISILAAMVWFDEDVTASATFLRDALRSAGPDEYAMKNIMRIFGHFFGAETVEELTAKLDKKIARG